MCYQGVEIIEYLCFKFVINECHKCSFTITLLLLWITVITQLLYIEANFLQKFRDVSMPNFSLFFNQGVLFLPWKSSTSFLWLKMFQWDSDRVTEQVVVVCVCVGQAGVCVWFSCPLWCRVKWRLYRKYTGGTLLPVISGMKNRPPGEME